jgi:hypothetical protein
MNSSIDPLWKKASIQLSLLESALRKTRILHNFGVI